MDKVVMSLLRVARDVVIGLLNVVLNTLLGVLEILRYLFGQGLKWVVLLLAILCFVQGVHFLLNGPPPMTGIPLGRQRYGFLRPPSGGGSLVMGVSFFITGWFLISHYRLRRRIESRDKDQ